MQRLCRMPGRCEFSSYMREPPACSSTLRRLHVRRETPLLEHRRRPFASPSTHCFRKIEMPHTAGGGRRELLSVISLSLSLLASPFSASSAIVPRSTFHRRLFHSPPLPVSIFFRDAGHDRHRDRPSHAIDRGSLVTIGRLYLCCVGSCSEPQSLSARPARS
jgi:hypothetical protein